MPKGDLERGWAKASLIRALAEGEKTQTQLAAEFGVTPSAVSLFASRNTDDIDHVRANLDDEWAGLWSAKKSARVAEYEADVERVNATTGDVVYPDLARVKHAALKSIAEELGQLKQNVDVTGTLTFTVKGIDLKDLT